MRSPIRTDPTVAAWLGVAAYVAIVDIALARRGRPTLSALARAHHTTTAVLTAVLTTHLWQHWRLDPIDHLARVLAR